MRVTVRDKQSADGEYLQLDLDFGERDARGRRTFLLATREHERIADHFVNLPVPLCAGRPTTVFCAHTPEGDVAAVGLSGKEPAELKAKLEKKLGG